MRTNENLAMKRWQLAILIFELALFALILVLPQVALPDFTVQGGTLPKAMQARRFSSPPEPAITLLPQPTLAGEGVEKLLDHTLDSYSFLLPHSRLSLLCTLIC